MKSCSYKIAQSRILIVSIYEDIHDYCRDYQSNEKPDFTVTTSHYDIEFEREKSCNDHIKYSDSYLEELAVYRKIAEKMPEYNTFLFHGSAISVNGLGYMFTASSGVGKSTHAKLWCDLLGNEAVMVNDDKPLIEIQKNNAVVYGTPFNGKHRRGNNISVPLKAICVLERSECNQIKQITANEAYTTLLQQTYRPSTLAAMTKTITLLDKLKTLVKFYRLACNMDIEAAELSYKTMKG